MLIVGRVVLVSCWDGSVVEMDVLDKTVSGSGVRPVSAPLKK